MKRAKYPEKKVGIWIDRESAFIVWLTEEGDTLLKRISSSVESRVRFPGEGKISARFGNAFIDDQEKKQRRQRNQLNKFFERIIRLISEADQVFIFGPGRAKIGLSNAIEKQNGFRGKVVDVRPADKMTAKGMRSFVTDFYGLTKPRFVRRRQES